MHRDWKIECQDTENEYIHTRIAYLSSHKFRFHQCHIVGLVAFRGEVTFSTNMTFRVEVAFPLEVASPAEVVFRTVVLPVLVEERRLLCSCRVSADDSLCHFGMECNSVSNGSSVVPGRFYRSLWKRPYPIKNRRFFKRTIALWLQILIREFSVWYI